MESNIQQQTTPKDLSTEVPGTITKKPSLGDQPWQEVLASVLDVLGKVPEYFGQFWDEYQQPLITVLLAILAIITVKIIVAVLGAIDGIPLLAPLLQMVGLGYTAWFVWRYLWKASNRKELLAEFDAIKNQMFGDNA
ncbi:MAG: CAAD domain-containing protein [Cyanobacteria bacterium P01_G01_bin.49]